MKFTARFFIFFLFSITSLEAYIPRYHAPLDIRVLNQDNFARIVFEWIGDTHYNVQENGNNITITFDRLTTFDPQIMTPKLPRRVGFKGVKTLQNQMIFSFEAYPNAQEKISARHYKQGFKIVLDIFFESKARAQPIYNTSVKNLHSTLRRIDQTKAIQKTEILPASQKIRINTKNNIDEIFIPIKGKVNPILYKRGTNLWLVQNSEQNWDISTLKKYLPKIFKQDKLTALLLNAPQTEMPQLLYEKTGVKLFFNEAAKTEDTKKETPFKLSRESILDSKIEIPLQNNKTFSDPIKFKDPLTGEDLYLLETDSNFAIPAEQKYIDFKLLKTSAGLSIIPYTDDLTFKLENKLLTISRPHGLRVAPELTEKPKEDLRQETENIVKHVEPKIEEPAKTESSKAELSKTPPTKEENNPKLPEQHEATKKVELPQTEESIKTLKKDEDPTKNLKNKANKTRIPLPEESSAHPEPIAEKTPTHPETIAENKPAHPEPTTEKAPDHPEPTTQHISNTFFDLTKWYPSNDFLKDRNIHEEKIIETDPPSPNSIYDLASFYIAHDLGAETQNLLRSFKEKTPESEKSSYFQGLMGISNLYGESYDAAIANFADKQLETDPNIPTWRWVANFLKNDTHDDKTIEAPKEINLSILPLYLRHSVYLRLLKNDLAQEKFDIFEQNYAQIKQNLLNSHERNYIDYLTGWLEYLKGNQIGGLQKWKTLATSFDRFTSSHARYAIASKGPENEFITKKEAIQDLEILRFAWRGDHFEYKVIKLLGNYLLDLSLHKRGLKALKTLITLFPNEPSNKEITTKLTETFTNIFVKDEISSKYSPMDLILLYEEFKELSPLDKNADLIQEKIAKSYFELNLPNDGQKILDHLLKFRSEGDEKARRGLTLAQTLAADQKTNEALSILDASDTPTIKPELAEERQKLKASILKQKGDLENALKLVSNKQDIENQRLKAQIFIDQKEWSKAAEIYDTICNTQKDLTTEKDIFYYMTCLVYTGNYNKIEEISKTYKDYMEKEPYKNAFLLIASTLKPGNIKNAKEQLDDFLAKFKTYNTSVTQ
ncbi:MAG: hypothetical protein Q8S31_00715 [Alphaproteobacteria bacterium]|nr:hypothetical protein [Alphaproteobacteria bacterium]